jgi:hypothetical protein
MGLPVVPNRLYIQMKVQGRKNLRVLQIYDNGGKRAVQLYIVIPRLTKPIRSESHSLVEIFVSRNVISHRLSRCLERKQPSRVDVSPYVMWSAHFFVTHIQTEKLSSWNGPTVHVCCFILSRASTKTFVSRIHIR